MANIRTCNKHNMIACVEKTAQNADFYQIIDYLTGCSINYSLLVDPDLIGPWLQQFWATASLRVINEVPHIRATVAGKKILISEATIRADLLFDDADGVDCFPKQVLWDSLRDIGYEGNLAQLTFSKPLFSPQWKYLVHVLLHCLSPKSTSWEQFGTNIASALVGLATNQKFNFSLMIMNGMLGHISNGTPFIMYPRFIQLFLNKQLEGVTRPQNFLPSVTLPSKVFTFMRKHSPKFSCRIPPLTPHMLEVVTALAAEEAHSTSPHSRDARSPRDAQGTPDQSAAQASISQGTAEVQGTDNSQGTAEVQGTADSFHWSCFVPHGFFFLMVQQGTDTLQDCSLTYHMYDFCSKSPLLDYTPTPVVQAIMLFFLGRKANTLSSKKRRRIRSIRKKWSSVKLGRNKVMKILCLKSICSRGDTESFFDDIVDKDAAVAPDIDRKSNETEVLERKSDETGKKFNIEEKEYSNVKRKAGPSSPLRPIQVMESEEQLKVAEVLVAISRPGGLSISGSIQTQPQQPTQEEERKRFEELKKTKPKTTLRKPTSLAQERNQMMNFLKGSRNKKFAKLKYSTDEGIV
ncbi:hypothetical protein Tco_0341609 [Tanacetum coccineum]